MEANAGTSTAAWRQPGHFTLALLALMASVPFLNPVHVYPITTFYEEALAIALGLAACLAALWSARRASAGIPSIALWTATLGLLALAQPLWSDLAYRQTAQLAGLYILWAAVMMWVGAQVAQFDAARVARVLASVILLCGLASAGVGVLQYLGAGFAGLPLPAPGAGARALGLLGQPNLHANYLVIGVACAGHLWAERRVSGLAAFACLAILGAGIYLAASRAALLQLAGLLALAAWYWRAQPFVARRHAAAIITCLAIVALCALVASLGEAGTTARVIAGQPQANAIRLSIYEAALRIWLSAPFVGVGFGGFAWGHFLTPTPIVGSVEMNAETYAHDMVLQLLAESGAVGAGIALCAVVLWYARNSPKAHAGESPWRHWALGIATIQLVHSLVEFPLWHAEFLGLAAVAMGLCETRLFRPRGGRVAAAGLAFAALIGFALVGSSVRDFRVIVSGLDQVREDRQQLSRLRGSLLAPHVDVHFAHGITVSREALEEKIAFNGRVLRFWPIAPLVQKQVLLLAMAGRDPEALQLLEHLARLQPASVVELYDVVQQLPDAMIPLQSPTRRAVGRMAARALGA